MSIFSGNPQWERDQLTPNERLLSAVNFTQFLEALSEVKEQVPEAARNKMNALERLALRLAEFPAGFSSVREMVRAEYPGGMYAALVRCLNKLLIEKAGVPHFTEREEVRLVEDGELKPGFVVVIDPKKQLSSDEIELFSFSNDDESIRKPLFQTVKRAQVVAAAQLA